MAEINKADISFSETAGAPKENIEIKVFSTESSKDFEHHIKKGQFPSKDSDSFPEGVYLERNINKKNRRENNSYIELIIDEKTGRVIRNVRTKLIDHKPKNLKFSADLVQPILSGQKTSTWRMFDDKNLQEGDYLHLINKETGEKFGEAIITSLKIKTLGTLTNEDLVGHQEYSSEDAMYADFRKHYGNTVNKDTAVKIIFFKLR